MARDRRRVTPCPPCPAPSLSTLLYLSTALLVLLSPPSATASPSPSTPSIESRPETTLHVPLYRQNGHLHALHKRSTRPEREELVREWAIREKGRVVNKYGQSEERLRKRQQSNPDVISSRIMFSTAGVGASGSVATSTVSGTVSGVETTTTETRTSPQTSATPTGPVGLVRMQNYEADLCVPTFIFLSLSLFSPEVALC